MAGEGFALRFLSAAAGGSSGERFALVSTLRRR
jgi:hypothetical protein